MTARGILPKEKQIDGVNEPGNARQVSREHEGGARVCDGSQAVPVWRASDVEANVDLCHVREVRGPEERGIEVNDAVKGGLWVAVIAGLVFGVHSCATSKWYVESQARDAQIAAAVKLAAETPHQIAVDDRGCRTMQFRRGDVGSYHWHTYTSCPNAVTAHQEQWDTTHTEGKRTVTDHHDEQVITQ